MVVEVAWVVGVEAVRFAPVLQDNRVLQQAAVGVGLTHALVVDLERGGRGEQGVGALNGLEG